MDQSNVDYEQMKNMYPLRGVIKEEVSISTPDPLGKISANDISAFNDDSMEQPNNPAVQMNLFGKNFDELDGGEFGGPDGADGAGV